MRHPTDGTLRRLVDEPAGVADADREHVAACPTCLAALASARDDAAAASEALGAAYTTRADEVDAAWQELNGTMARDGRRSGSAISLDGGRRASALSASRWRAALRKPVVAGVGVVALVTGAGVAAAADWLPIFRTEQIAPVTITESDLVALPDLSAYGDLRVEEAPNLREVADLEAAENAAGISVMEVGELPRGVTGEPTYQVGDRVVATFTFSAEKAARATAKAGKTLPPPPAGLDGSQFRLVAGPGVAAVWQASSGLPGLIVARAVAPTGQSSGVAFETARDYLLSLPGMPEDVASQLRSFSGDGTTLPLPIPAELVSTSEADVDGIRATVLTSRDGTMAGVVWVDHGIVTAVAGSLSADEVLTVARGLR